MEITLEMVERLREKASVSYAEAKPPMTCLLHLRRPRSRPRLRRCPSGPPGSVRAFFGRCAGGWWKTSWRSGAGRSL